MSRDLPALVAQLDTDEKSTLLAGADLFSTAAVERLGIPSVRLTDGANGARGPVLPGASDEGEPSTSTCVPCGAALGATWDPALVERIGALVGRQALTKTCRILLAPTVNLHRSPLGGRNFESYSEDPLLAGRLGAAYVRGAQSSGVACTVKHFAGNEYEKDRMLSDSVIDERALRELHLLPFELAVSEGGALAVMTSYNRLNGEYCPDSPGLLQGLLRDEWGFDGFVVTDWYGFAHTERAIVAGLDLEMPGPGRAYGPPLADAVRADRVDGALVDAAALRFLSVMDRIGALDDDPDAAPRSEDRPEDRRLARDAAVCAGSRSSAPTPAGRSSWAAGRRACPRTTCAPPSTRCAIAWDRMSRSSTRVRSTSPGPAPKFPPRGWRRTGPRAWPSSSSGPTTPEVR
jgi:beta-glucosidase